VFYSGVLGLRLVKLTVNFDDPETYHLYYGNGSGTPGTILTFFPWPGAPRGRHGTSQATVISFSVPADALPYWEERLKAHGTPVDGRKRRFGRDVLAFRDRDGLQLELVAGDDSREPWTNGPVPAEWAIRGFYSVTLAEAGYERTADLLTATLGFRHAGEHGNRFRFEAAGGGPGAIVDVECLPDLPPGRIAAGTVHHVAFRARDDAAQAAWREKIVATGLNVTPIIDRQYFHSVYFREPGGVLFEIATDPPGFAVDQPLSELGTRLMLPSWLEPMRSRIENSLPKLTLPVVARGA
jgi:glyoxalase family protein